MMREEQGRNISEDIQAGRVAWTTDQPGHDDRIDDT